MTDMRKYKSQRDIQAALITCLSRQSFTQITVNDICREGLVGRSTFYHHYPDKYAVLSELVEQQAARFDTLLDARLVDPLADSGLLALYTGLSEDVFMILPLLKVHEPEGDLSTRYLASLRRHAAQLLPEVSQSVPQDFLLELYASTAYTAITWALRRGSADQISTFMNGLVKSVLTGKS